MFLYVFPMFQILDRKNAEIEDVKVQHRNKNKELEDHIAKTEKKSTNIWWFCWMLCLTYYIISIL